MGDVEPPIVMENNPVFTQTQATQAGAGVGAGPSGSATIPTTVIGRY